MAKVLFIGVLILDQLIKYLVAAQMELGQSKVVIDGIFNITYILNPGAAFGILANQRAFFVLAGLVIIGVFVANYRRLRQYGTAFFYGGVSLIAGAVGNLIDRVRLGCVIDFLDLRVWPIFNLVDIAIVLGVSFMMYSILFTMKETE